MIFSETKTMWLNFRPYFQINFLVCKLLYSIEISQQFVPKFSINYESALVQRVSLHQRGDRPLSQAIIIQCWPCFWTYVRISRPRVNPYRAEWILVTHDDVKRKKFPGYRPFMRRIHREFHAQRPVTRNFDVFFDLRPNKRLSKQSGGWWFETPSSPLWCHCNDKSLSEFLRHWDDAGSWNIYENHHERQGPTCIYHTKWTQWLLTTWRRGGHGFNRQCIDLILTEYSSLITTNLIKIIYFSYKHDY